MHNYKNEALEKSFKEVCKRFESVDEKLNELRSSDKPMNKLLYQELLEDFNEYAELFNSSISDLIAGYELRELKNISKNS